MGDIGDISYANSMPESFLTARKRTATVEPRLGKTANDEKERKVILSNQILHCKAETSGACGGVGLGGKAVPDFG
jgi:hypothetical protein